MIMCILNYFLPFLLFPVILLGSDLPPSPEKILENMEINELEHLDHLITITQKNLKRQEELKALLLAFETAKSALEHDIKNNEKAKAVIKHAKKVWDLVNHHRLTHLFRQEYLDELKVFARVNER